MSAISISSPFPTFTDVDGDPLESGYIYVGQANVDPVTFPITVYWDAALTIPAAQPIRTIGGYPARNGSPARIYANSDYSIRVTNKNGSLVYSAPAATDRFSGVVVDVDAADVAYTPAGTGAVATTVQQQLRNIQAWTVNVKDAPFYAKGDGSTDDTAAIQAALTSLNSAGGGKLWFPSGGTYIVSELTTYSNVFIDLGGSTIKQKAGAVSAPIIHGTSVTNAAIVNGKFDGNKANVTGNLAGGVQFVGSNNISIQNLDFDSIRRICINIDSCSQVNIDAVQGVNIGVAGAALGTLVAVVNNSANVKLNGASISMSDGVGAQFFNSRQVSIENYKAQTIGTDNGLVVEECTNVAIKNITASGCANHGIEVNSSTNVSIENIECFSNGVYGLMISTFTGGTEQACVGVSLKNVYCHSNGTQDIRLIGAQYLAATGLNVTGTLNITNSAGGVVTKNIDLIESTVDTLLLNSGSYIRLADCAINTLTNVGANFTINDSTSRPITGFSGSIANGGSTTIHVPTGATGAFNGLLVVGSYFIASITTQNTAAVYNLSQYGSTNVTTLSSVDGSVAGRQVTVTVSANTITLTNSTGVDCFVSASLFAVTI